MFTGIIQALGKISAIENKGGDARMQIDTGSFDIKQAAIGDSIAVSGVCLTVVEKHDKGFTADVSGETLARTTLGNWQAGTPVNIEPALTLQTPLGGHLVSGHVDGVGEVVKRWDDGRSVRFIMMAPAELAKYIAEKGSICVDGISLTVNKVDGAQFELNIVPHTLQVTSMGEFQPGRKVNLEVDLIARYTERLLMGEQAAQSGSTISREFLAEHGFLKQE